MKILFLNYEYPPLGGGAGQAAANILKEYARVQDLEVDYVTSSIDGNYHLERLGEHIRVHKLPIGKNPGDLTFQTRADLLAYTWRAYRFSRQLVRREAYDGIHAFFTIPCGFLALLFRYRYRLPYIVSLRGSDVPGYNERFSSLHVLLKPLTVSIWKHSHFVVANSEALRQLALLSSPGQAIETICNGVNTETFRPGDGRLKDPSLFRILCASRLTRRKGFRYAIEAFARLESRYPHVRLVLAGGQGEAEKELRAQAKALGLEDKITFTGYVPHDQFLHYYQMADAFLLPSLNEGMSNNMLEAMASGLPIVMTATGGAAELIQDGESGFVIRKKDSADTAAKLERLIQNPELARQMGRKSRERAEAMSWTKVAQAYVSMYQAMRADH